MNRPPIDKDLLEAELRIIEHRLAQLSFSARNMQEALDEQFERVHDLLERIKEEK